MNSGLPEGSWNLRRLASIRGLYVQALGVFLCYMRAEGVLRYLLSPCYRLAIYLGIKW